MDFISIRDLRFSYDTDIAVPKYALDGINLGIGRGEFVAVLGHNGCGKSTLAKHLNGILQATSGSVTVDGIDTSDERTLFDLRQKVGMVFQNPDNQLVATIVEEDVAFALENLGVPQAEMRRRVDKALEEVGMSEYSRFEPHKLSGGQKQRVAIAGIIAMEPECIVLDEPTAMLDPHGRRSVMRTIKKLREELGITIILVTHYMDEATEADRVIVMDHGKILLDGTPKKIFSQVNVLKKAGLDVPHVTELALMLSRDGVKIPTDIITESEFTDYIISEIKE